MRTTLTSFSYWYSRTISLFSLTDRCCYGFTDVTLLTSIVHMINAKVIIVHVLSRYLTTKLHGCGVDKFHKRSNPLWAKLNLTDRALILPLNYNLKALLLIRPQRVSN
jgi:hypothetical protein